MSTPIGSAFFPWFSVSQQGWPTSLRCFRSMHSWSYSAPLRCKSTALSELNCLLIKRQGPHLWSSCSSKCLFCLESARHPPNSTKSSEWFPPTIFEQVPTSPWPLSNFSASSLWARVWSQQPFSCWSRPSATALLDSRARLSLEARPLVAQVSHRWLCKGPRVKGLVTWCLRWSKKEKEDKESSRDKDFLTVRFTAWNDVWFEWAGRSDENLGLGQKKIAGKAKRVAFFLACISSDCLPGGVCGPFYPKGIPASGMRHDLNGLISIAAWVRFSQGHV